MKIVNWIGLIGLFFFLGGFSMFLSQKKGTGIYYGGVEKKVEVGTTTEIINEISTPILGLGLYSIFN